MEDQIYEEVKEAEKITKGLEKIAERETQKSEKPNSSQKYLPEKIILKLNALLPNSEYVERWNCEKRENGIYCGLEILLEGKKERRHNLINSLRIKNLPITESSGNEFIKGSVSDLEYVITFRDYGFFRRKGERIILNVFDKSKEADYAQKLIEAVRNYIAAYTYEKREANK